MQFSFQRCHSLSNPRQSPPTELFCQSDVQHHMLLSSCKIKKLIPKVMGSDSVPPFTFPTKFPSHGLHNRQELKHMGKQDQCLICAWTNGEVALHPGARTLAKYVKSILDWCKGSCRINFCSGLCHNYNFTCTHTHQTKMTTKWTWHSYSHGIPIYQT